MARIVKTGGAGISPNLDRLMRLSASNFSTQAVEKLERESTTTRPAISRISTPISFSGTVTGVLNRTFTLPNTGTQLLGGIRELIVGGRPADASRNLSVDLSERMCTHFNPSSTEGGRPSNPIMRKGSRPFV